jgi:hypothetical protein
MNALQQLILLGTQSRRLSGRPAEVQKTPELKAKLGEPLELGAADDGD